MAVQRQKCVVRFGFVHLLVTNIAMWVCTAVSEIQTDYTVGRHQLSTPTAPSTTGLNLPHTPMVTVISVKTPTTHNLSSNPNSEP